MKKLLSIIIVLIISISSVLTLSSCAAKALEEELNVVFMNEGKIVANGKITQFVNYLSPELDDAYVPDGYKFCGWTPYSPEDIDPAAADFKTRFVKGGNMVHYTDVKGFESNRTVVMNALIIEKSLIPKDYHYVVIAWYAKTDTSGISQAQMDTLGTRLKTYLASEGVSEEDLATIVIRGYTGGVGTSCGQIMKDEDVDIMLGWGSASNVIETGGMKESMLLESVTFSVLYNGATKKRTIHRLTDSGSVVKVTAWLQTEDCTSIFNS